MSEHDWFQPSFMKHECCRKCGIVRRADDKNSPCKGVVLVRPREIDVLRAKVELLREAHHLANEALRSAWAIAEREGQDVNWTGHRAQLLASLEASHAAMAALSPPTAGDATNGQ